MDQEKNLIYSAFKNKEIRDLVFRELSEEYFSTKFTKYYFQFLKELLHDELEVVMSVETAQAIVEELKIIKNSPVKYAAKNLFKNFTDLKRYKSHCALVIKQMIESQDAHNHFSKSGYNSFKYREHKIIFDSLMKYGRVDKLSLCRNVVHDHGILNNTDVMFYIQSLIDNA